ncbi:EAL domain-containing protein [Floridanema evergladense]|uniref:EAL domain-containing protein n=1 Tax=Floridaenema evergladense BLCC-F167 TaxID=3153639 RepID=A0ABV4WMA4_9CYAN
MAEGIETEQQLRILQGLGCDFAQGFFFARPLNVQSVQAMLMGKMNSL